jgi:hypothetical protein
MTDKPQDTTQQHGNHVRLYYPPSCRLHPTSRLASIRDLGCRRRTNRSMIGHRCEGAIALRSISIPLSFLISSFLHPLSFDLRLFFFCLFFFNSYSSILPYTDLISASPVVVLPHVLSRYIQLGDEVVFTQTNSSSLNGQRLVTHFVSTSHGYQKPLFNSLDIPDHVP